MDFKVFKIVVLFLFIYKISSIDSTFVRSYVCNILVSGFAPLVLMYLLIHAGSAASSFGMDLIDLLTFFKK